MSTPKTREDLRRRAEEAIERGEEWCIDLACDNGNLYDNVKHMQWFLRACMQELIDTTEQWSHLGGV